MQGIVQLPPWDIGAVRACLDDDPDIAAVILEPTGATFGRVPNTPEFIRDLRAITEAHAWC